MLQSFHEDMRPRLPNHAAMEVRDYCGRLKQIVETTNLITTDGIDWAAGVLGNASGAPAKYVAVTENTGSPSAGDTTLTGELASDGLTRAVGSYSHTSGVRSYTVSKVFTVTGGPHVVAKSALFDASSGGTMVFEALFSTTATVTSSDTLTVTWTVNF